MAYTFDITLPSAWFMVPISIVKRHLVTATEIEIKVILWLLASGEGASEEACCDILEITPSVFTNAVAAWVDRGVLAVKEKRIVLSPPTVDTPVPKKRKSETRRPSYRFEEIEAALTEKPDLKSALMTGQGILGRTFSPTEYEVLYSLSDYYGLEAEAILMLFSLCKSEGNVSLKKIEDFASKWQQLGISSATQAEQYIVKRRSRRSAESVVRTLFGLGDRKLSTRESDYIARWSETLCFEREMIKTAYERCVDTIGKLSFAYIDTILSDWKQKGITDIVAAAAETPPKRGSKKKKVDTKSEPSYDLDGFSAWSFDAIYGETKGAEGEALGETTMDEQNQAYKADASGGAK